jgi:hypothetical protein
MVKRRKDRERGEGERLKTGGREDSRRKKSQFNKYSCWVWWGMPIIPAIERWRQ